MKKYTKEEKEAIRRCREKWQEIKNNNKGYVEVKSCNKDISMYLVPDAKSIKQITYASKPEFSYRFSDHWNWYANTKENSDESYIQCYSSDLLEPFDRMADGKASNPIFAISIGFFEDGEYHVIFGDKYDFDARKWVWVE